MNTAFVANPVAEVLRQRKIPPLPRNYELFYEALNGANSRLLADLSGLGLHPNQEALDALYEKHLGPLRRAEALDTVESGLSREIEALLGLLERQKRAAEKHDVSLNQFHSSLGGKEGQLGELMKAILAMRSATSETMASRSGVLSEAQKSAEVIQKTKKLIQDYKRQALIDSLTGLYNRNAYDDRLAYAFANKGQGEGLAVILLDIDNYKKLVEVYGQPLGDKVVAAAGRVFAKLANRQTCVARLRGDEFALIAENVNVQEAGRLAEMARQDFAAAFSGKGMEKAGKLSLSAGVSMAEDAADSADFHQNSAIALFAAKNSGRNCMRVYDPAIAGQLSGKRVLYRGIN